MTATKPKLELVSAKEPNTCYACSGLGYYQAKTNGELLLCECVNDLCKKCDSNEYDKKRRYIYNDSTAKLENCKCMPFSLKFNQIKKLYDKSNIPKRYKLASLDLNMDHDKSLSLLVNTSDVKDFLSTKELPKRGFYFQGNTGSGKTHVACAILNNLILTRGMEGRYCKVTRDFIEAIKATFNKEKYWNEDSTSKAIEIEFQTVPVLVIDDFGVQKDSPWVLEKLFDLIDTRCEFERLTIITSNDPIDAWKGIFKNRIYSRLKEMCEEKFFEAPDYREPFGGAA